jgi:impB/mucB/samB family
MRIACVHVPQFALQCVTRIDPSLRGAAIAVVGAGLDPGAGMVTRAALHSPVVMACSRAAWALGVRVGMTAPAARNASPEVRVVSADAQLERDTLRAIADTLLGASPVVDLGGRVGPGGAHLAMYCEVPSRTRGGVFGERLLDRLSAMGVSCRVGIADDRFTAWVAASSPVDARDGRPEDGAVVTVPRGGSAAFLAPRPLSLLAISPEVQHMLEALGVRTLGEFAALPAPSVARPVEADYQALARGDSGNVLRPYAPDLAIREHATIGPGGALGGSAGSSAGALSGPAAIAMLAHRIELRLTGRGRGAARLELTVGNESGERTIAISPGHDGRVLETAEDLAESIGDALGGDLGSAWRLRVVVVGEALAPAAAATAPAPAAEVGEAAAQAAVAQAAAAKSADAVVEMVDFDETGGVRVAERVSESLMLPLLQAERREGHRRTRHGKRRPRARASEAAADSLLQPKLFKNQP